MNTRSLGGLWWIGGCTPLITLLVLSVPERLSSLLKLVVSAAAAAARFIAAVRNSHFRHSLQPPVLSPPSSFFLQSFSLYNNPLLLPWVLPSLFPKEKKKSPPSPPFLCLYPQLNIPLFLVMSLSFFLVKSVLLSALTSPINKSVKHSEGFQQSRHFADFLGMCKTSKKKKLIKSWEMKRSFLSLSFLLKFNKWPDIARAPLKVSPDPPASGHKNGDF